MNGAQSDGNENIVDIFVLSTSTTDSPVQAGHLEKLGYRLTFFSDSRQLFESLRSGKPNLLICDSLSLQNEAFELCRDMKADYDLWVVPVLIVTRASNLADLLHVLDCNADNFISYPYDPSYLSALIGGMISAPVERQTSEQVKTQFKIQHDEQMFVVTADRRRLLEFLLSSFEIAVNRAGDISRITGENENLARSLEQVKEQVRDQARLIGNLEATVRQKERAVSTLTADSEEKAFQIQKNSEEILRLAAEIESGKAHIAAAEEQIDRITKESEDLAHRYSSETGTLSKQLSTLSDHIRRTTADLRLAEEALAIETTQKTEAQARLSETAMQKEQAEKSVQALSRECEQLRESLMAEKDRARSTEDELNSLLKAKSESEQDKARIIDELTNTARQQDTDLKRQADELESGKNRIVNLEIQLANGKKEKEQSDMELRSRAETYARDLAGLQENLDRARAALDERNDEIASLKITVGEVQEARDTTVRKLEALTSELDSMKVTYTSDKKEHAASEESLHAGIRERDTALNTLRGELQSALTGYEEQKKILVQVRSDLDTALTGRSDLEISLSEAAARIRELESEIKTATTAHAHTGKQAHALADELEQVKAELENSRRQRRSIEESLTGERLEKERTSSDLQNASREIESLKSAFDMEKQLRGKAESERDRLLQLLASAETEGKDQETSLTATIRELNAELASSRALLLDLEGQVSTLSREKQIADENASHLSDEIDQARTALADEWEDHMNAQERLIAATHEKQQMKQSVQQSDELESEKAKKRALIVKGPDLPMDIGKRPQSLSAVPPADQPEPVGPPIRNVEDLFEDDASSREEETGEVPSVSIIHEPSADADEGSGRSMAAPAAESEEAVPDDSEEDAPDGDIPEGIAFDRAQWFDLLKWAHHSGTLTQDQRMQIVRMGRLIQKGRKLTHKQEEMVKEMLILVREQGYRFT